MEKPIENTSSQPSSSRSSSRRTSGTIPRESLPTPPPDPRITDNVFKYPPEKKDLPIIFHSLLEYAEQADEFYKNLYQAIADDCSQMHEKQNSQTAERGDSINLESSKYPKENDVHEVHKCSSCQALLQECAQLVEPLQNRLGLSIGAALATYGAVEQLNRLFSIWDQYCDLEKKFRKQKECLKYINLLSEEAVKVQLFKERDSNILDTEWELEKSIALLDTILANDSSASLKRSKMQRERSKSVMDHVNHERDCLKGSSTMPHLLRRQSTYSDNKSKVSKWTKVKAAFKWERANVPAAGEVCRDVPNGVGLIPVNHEVARYLRVPSAPGGGGGSSADSILSTSSGHLLSETGTPGTISSASSMDELDSSCRHTSRRDSIKSDNRSDSRILDDADSLREGNRAEASSTSIESQKLLCNEENRNAVVGPTVPIVPSKSSLNKSLRKCKVVSDFETLPEDDIANIKSTPTRRLKPPLSPLNLNLKQDFSDFESLHSPHSLKSPKDGSLSFHRSKKVNSPGNSSVPSSPSRHSDFFAEFESEDLSSGDFSEPTSPSHLSSRKTFQQKQDEINKRYQMLRVKLDQEFEAKRREWEKMKSNSNASRALALINSSRSEENSPSQVHHANLSAKLLEENLTPDFKKKLRKWRVKKQISLSGAQNQPLVSPVSPHKESVQSDPKAKIDWNLWKTGQLKLEGQGLSPLPDQKNLPEEFQKKLEQWNKIKRGGGAVGGGGGGIGFTTHGNDSIKRAFKHTTDGFKKGTDEDRSAIEKDKRMPHEKHKPHERDKLEKLAKLKAIVTDHPAKEIEVKTSEGVMKFEGISRKFTRKLYEWEKARGIGPESSTFALLHPGYCPIDVVRISKETNKIDNSPTLSRSLSLDSVAPPNITLSAVSHQASSLSLNDMNDMKEMENVSSCDALADTEFTEFKKFDEPEAVMVEVEDHIVETASPLIATHTFVEQQTPVYKYEEVACNDFCNTRRVQSFESYTNLAPLLSALKRTDELFGELMKASSEIKENEIVRRCESLLVIIRNIYPYYTENLVKANVLNAISDVQSELGRINDLHLKSPLNEACCREIMEERNHEYNEELRGLQESLELLIQRIHGGVNWYLKDIVPDINIISEDGPESSINETCDTTASMEQMSPARPTSDEILCQTNHFKETTHITPTTPTTLSTTPFSNLASCSNGNTVSSSATTATTKKKRLRKIGSRQNSKTESESSDDDTHSLLETPRRLKRKNYRFKQHSLDEDYRRTGDSIGNESLGAEDVVYVLKVKPGEPIQQLNNTNVEHKSFSRKLNGRTESCVELGTLEWKAPVDTSTDLSNNGNPNVFVKTKRKVFTTIEEPSANEGIALVEHDVEQAEHQAEQQVKEIEHKMDHIEPCTLQTARKPSQKVFINKSFSLTDIRVTEYSEENKCHSLENIHHSRYKREKGVRAPLASDSFKVINKSFISLNREARNTQRPIASAAEGDTSETTTPGEKRKTHRYRKNPDKNSSPLTGKSVGSTIKKIETKIAKTNSGSSVDTNLLPPDRMDNTLPRISRKLERKSITPTTQITYFEYPTPDNSEQGNPLPNISSAPRTPLSERAQRLQKAKEEFLQNRVQAAMIEGCKRRDEIVRSETWQQYRCSDNSLTSTATEEDSGLSKSLSVDTITADTALQSDAGTDIDIGIYDSLPRTVSRSAKISSKLGFANLASKFRRIKVKKPKDTGAESKNALSALCRQSLLVDAISAPHIMAHVDRSRECIVKSQSSPQATAYEDAASSDIKHQVDRLNKSQSEQYVKPQKESPV